MKNNINILLSAVLLACTGYLFYQHKSQQSQIAQLLSQQERLVAQIEQIFAGPEENYLDKGTTAPEFSLLDEDGRQQGIPANLNRKKLLVFSSAECSYCQAFYPVLDNFAKAHQDTDVVVVQDLSTPASNKQFKDSTQYQFTLLEGKNQVFADYGISGTPTTVLLTEDNKVDTTFVASTLQDLENVL